MSRLKRPYDKNSAMELMKKFSDLAYSLSHKEFFQEAVHILYGREFNVTSDLSRRMQFSCGICNREMNSENAMAEHFRSGAHQKNLDKKNREMGEPNFQSRASHYATDSMQFKLLNTHVPPVGLQMIEEYINRRGNTYFKCFLCGAHGKIDTMYHHITGKKHTEKYIKSACVLENSILTSNEREEIRQKLVAIEGVNVDAIKTIRGDEFYPKKWEAEGFATKLYNMKIKKENRSLSRSPSPGPSKRNRSMSRSRSRSRSFSRSTSISRRRSRSPYSRKSRAKRSVRSKSRRSPSSNSSCSSSSRKSRSLSPKRKRQLSPKFSPETPIPIPRCSVARDVGDLLSQFRNKSPPPLSHVKIEPVTPQVHPESVDNALREPLPVDNVLREPLPVELCKVKVETKDSEVQTKADLEELMMQLNNVVRSHQMNINSELVTGHDVLATISLMDTICESLRLLSVSVLEDSSYKSAAKIKLLDEQREKREKILGYVRKWYKPTWEREHKTSIPPEGLNIPTQGMIHKRD